MVLAARAVCCLILLAPPEERCLLQNAGKRYYPLEQVKYMLVNADSAYKAAEVLAFLHVFRAKRCCSALGSHGSS